MKGSEYLNYFIVQRNSEQLTFSSFMSDLKGKWTHTATLSEKEKKFLLQIQNTGPDINKGWQSLHKKTKHKQSLTHTPTDNAI